MQKLISVIYVASVLTGNVCLMQMASAASLPQPVQVVEYVQQSLMSPYMPLTLSAPMSVAAVVGHSVSSPMAQALGPCPGGNCIMVDHTQKQAIVVSSANRDLRQAAALPAAIPSIIASMTTPPPLSPHRGGPHLANTIATIVLRV